MNLLSKNKILMLLAVLFIAISCGEEDIIELPAKQYPVTTFIAEGNLIKDNDCPSSCGSFEFGIYFTPQTNGTIEALIIALPNSGNRRITLWNAISETILLTDTVSVETNVEKRHEISPIELIKGRQYALTMNSMNFKTWISGTTSGILEDAFPTTVQDIRLDKYAHEETTNQILPKTDGLEPYFIGLIDFEFQPAAE